MATGEHSLSTDTPTSTPTASALIRATPVPVNLEKFIQKLLAVTLPLGNPERFVRDLIIEGIKARLPTMTATRTSALVASNILRILSEDV